MEHPINHLHVPSCFVDGGDVFLTLTCGSSSSSSSASSEATVAAEGTPPPVLRGRRRRRRRRQGQQASSSFDCRTCGREFPTFQALGGHRTSHLRRPATTTKKKPVLVHACIVCGLGFSTGQALGGHMRRHRGGPDVHVCAVDLAGAVGLHERPRSTASLQLLDLFV